MKIWILSINSTSQTGFCHQEPKSINTLEKILHINAILHANPLKQAFIGIPKLALMVIIDLWAHIFGGKEVIVVPSSFFDMLHDDVPTNGFGICPSLELQGKFDPRKLEFPIGGKAKEEVIEVFLRCHLGRQ